MLSAAFRESPSERSEGANNIPVHKCAMRVWVYMCMCVVYNYGVSVCILLCMCVYVHTHTCRKKGGEGVHDILEKGGYPNSSAKR